MSNPVTADGAPAAQPGPPSPPVSSGIYPNDWTQPKRKFGIARIIAKVLEVGTITALLALGITFLDHQRSEEADRAADLELFRELLTEAESLYCEQQGQDSFTYEVKRIIDRASQLVPRIESRLLPVDYLSLAAVGSEVCDQAQAEEYAVRAVELCTNAPHLSTDDFYAAQLTLGHIRFRLHCETGDQAVLLEAQRDFDLAIKCKQGTLDRSKQLRGEAWLRRAFLEGYCGESQTSELCFRSAEEEWNSLPNAKHLLNKIGLVKKKISNGIRPLVDCPSQLSIAPSVAIVTEDDAPSVVEATPIPPTYIETSSYKSKHEGELILLTTALVKSMDKLVSALDSSFPRGSSTATSLPIVP